MALPQRDNVIDEIRRTDALLEQAVMRAYGFPEGLAESEIVARLFALYAKLAEKL